jgi:uncharacterized membrane protein
VIPSKTRTIKFGKSKEGGEATFIIDDSTSEGEFKGYSYLENQKIVTLSNEDFAAKEKSICPVEKMMTKPVKPKVVVEEKK